MYILLFERSHDMWMAPKIMKWDRIELKEVTGMAIIWEIFGRPDTATLNIKTDQGKPHLVRFVYEC